MTKIRKMVIMFIITCIYYHNYQIFNGKFFRINEDDKKRQKKQKPKSQKGSVSFAEQNPDDDQNIIIPNSQPEVGKRPLRSVFKSSQLN